MTLAVVEPAHSPAGSNPFWWPGFLYSPCPTELAQCQALLSDQIVEAFPCDFCLPEMKKHDVGKSCLILCVLSLPGGCGGLGSLLGAPKMGIGVLLGVGISCHGCSVKHLQGC